MISQQAAGLPQCFKGSYPVRWAARRAVVALPERTGHADAGQVSEDPLPAVNRGADALIVEMTATISCNYTGADALLRAVANGTEMRPAVTGSILRRALSLSGLNHLIPIYPSLEAAIAASEPAPAGAARRRRRPGYRPRQSCGGSRTPRMTGRHWHRALVLASRRPEETFSDIGKRIAWPPGRFADRDGLREARPGHGTAFAQATTPRPAGTGARLAGASKDGARFPAEVRRTPVHTPAAQFTLTVIPDAPGTGRKPPPAFPGPRPGESTGTRPGSGRPAHRQLVPRRSQPAAALESSRDVAGPRTAQVPGTSQRHPRHLAAPRQGTASRPPEPAAQDTVPCQLPVVAGPGHYLRFPGRYLLTDPGGGHRCRSRIK